MSKDEHHITEVSDPRELTIDDAPTQGVEEIKVVKGEPTDEELAALVAVLAPRAEAAPNRARRSSTCGAIRSTSCATSPISWQRVTLLERTHMRH